jgi:hypothetical protein
MPAFRPTPPTAFCIPARDTTGSTMGSHLDETRMARQTKSPSACPDRMPLDQHLAEGGVHAG